PKVWHDFREAEDPEAPITVHNGKRFNYENFPKKAAKGSSALPDPGTFRSTLGQGISHSSSASTESAGTSAASASKTPLASGLQGLLAFPHAESNALVV